MLSGRNERTKATSISNENHLISRHVQWGMCSTWHSWRRKLMCSGSDGGGGGPVAPPCGRPALIPSRDRGSLHGRRVELTYQTCLFCRYQMAIMVPLRLISFVVPCAPHTAEIRNYCTTFRTTSINLWFWRSSCKSDTKVIYSYI